MRFLSDRTLAARLEVGRQTSPAAAIMVVLSGFPAHLKSMISMWPLLACSSRPRRPGTAFRTVDHSNLSSCNRDICSFHRKLFENQTRHQNRSYCQTYFLRVGMDNSERNFDVPSLWKLSQQHLQTSQPLVQLAIDHILQGCRKSKNHSGSDPNCILGLAWGRDMSLVLSLVCTGLGAEGESEGVVLPWWADWSNTGIPMYVGCPCSET